MTKTTDFLVTATEVKTMVNAKVAVADTQQSVIKTGDIGVTNNFYVNENQADLATYTSNRLPRYQDIECPPAGLAMTVYTASVNDTSVTNPIYNADFTYIFQITATSTFGQTGDAVFTTTLPANVTLVAFRFVKYNGSLVPLPTSDYYVVTDFNTTTGYVRIVLKKPIYGTSSGTYQIAFNARPNQQYGTFTDVGSVTATYQCPTAFVATATSSFTLYTPAVAVTKTIRASNQSNCITAKQYRISITNPTPAGSVAAGVLTDTLPVGLTLLNFSAIYYDGVLCPVPTSDYYNITQYQENVNGGAFSVTFVKEIGNGHYYDMDFYVANNSTTATYTNTANYVNGTISVNGSNTSSFTTYSATTYYELYGCVNGNYAYTTLVPFGVNNRYVNPSGGDYYIYTGASVSQCTVPPTYNSSLQRTTTYNCVDPTTTCNPSPNWVNTGTSCYGSCNLYYVQTDQNTCSGDPTSGQTRQGALIQSNSTSCGGCCGQSTSANWQNNGNYSCYGTCDNYYIQTDVNGCSPTSGQTRQGSVYQYNSTACGGCCGQSTSANWVNNGSYSCYGSCDQYYIQVDNNPCSSTYNQTRQGSVYQYNTSYCGGCCGSSPSANWVNNGSTFCSGCYLQQPQIDNNPCSFTYGQTRDVDLGVNTSCGYWAQSFYCVGYNKWSKETNSCTGNVRNEYEVQANSPYCGYVPPPTCRTYQIIGYNSDEYVDGVYTNCAGFSDSFSFYGGPGTVGYICAQPSSVYITSGNGAANDVGSC
jgi:hypothetical protein